MNLIFNLSPIQLILSCPLLLQAGKGTSYSWVIGPYWHLSASFKLAHSCLSPLSASVLACIHETLAFQIDSIASSRRYSLFLQSD